MAFCAKCGTQMADGTAFCPSCGAPQAGAPAGGATTTSSGIESNVAAALAYLWLIGILWLILEPYNKDRFIRFHSFQAIAFGIVAFVVSIFLGFIPFIGWVMVPFWWLACVLIGLFCMYKAYSKEWFKLPVIGDFAEKQAGPA